MNCAVHRPSYFFPSEETMSLFSNRPDHFNGAVLGLPVELRSASFCANRIVSDLTSALLAFGFVAGAAYASQPPKIGDRYSLLWSAPKPRSAKVMSKPQKARIPRSLWMMTRTLPNNMNTVY